jgi:hypothetical protein
MMKINSLTGEAISESLGVGSQKPNTSGRRPESNAAIFAPEAQEDNELPAMAGVRRDKGRETANKPGHLVLPFEPPPPAGCSPDGAFTQPSGRTPMSYLNRINRLELAVEQALAILATAQAGMDERSAIVVDGVSVILNTGLGAGIRDAEAVAVGAEGVAHG